MKFLKKYWFVIFILIIASVLRFYRLPELFFFNIDDEWFNYIVRKIVVLHKPILIGWEIPGGLQVPPVLYYFGAILMFIFRGNPLGFAINASIISVIGVLLSFYVGRYLFNSYRIGIYSAIIYCFSYLINIYSKVTIIYLGPILSLLVYLSLLKIIDKRKKWLYVLAITLVFSTQEGSVISLIVLSVLTLLLYKVKLKLKDYIFPLLIFLSCFTPLIIFDLRHDFQLSKKIVNFMKPKTESQFSVNSIIPYYQLMFRTFTRMIVPTGPNDLNIQILPCNKNLNIINSQTPFFYPIIGIFFFLFFIFSSSSKQIKKGKTIILYHFLIIMIGLLIYSFIYPGYLHEWFFISFTPAFIFVIAYFLNHFNYYKFGKYTVVILLGVFIFLNLRYIYKENTSFGYLTKLTAVKNSIKTVGDKNFELEILGDGCNGYGYRYLYTYLNKEPVKSYTDGIFGGWLYPISNHDAEYKVVFVPKTDMNSQDLKKYMDYREKTFKIENVKNLELLYLRNK